MIKANKKQILILLSGVGMALSLAVQAEGTHEKGDIFVKGKLMYVYPTSSSSDTFDINGYDTEVEYAGGNANPIAANIAASYFVTDNVAVEFNIDTSYKGQFTADGTYVDESLGTVPIGDLGDTRFISPSLFAQFHLLPAYWIDPYVGLGIHSSMAFRPDVDNNLSQFVYGGNTNYTEVPTAIDVDSVTSWAVQAGVDVYLGKDWIMGQEWYGNMDVKYLDMTTRLYLTPQAEYLLPGAYNTYGGTVTPPDTSNIVTNSGNVSINPILINMGIGTRF